MASRVHVRIYTNDWRTLLVELTTFNALDWVLNENDEGAMTLVIPPVIPFSYFGQDTIIEIWRSIDGGPLKLEGDTIWLVDDIIWKVDGAEELLTISAHDAKTILARRYHLFYAGTSDARYTGPADDAMKSVVSKNMTSAADPDRYIYTDSIVGITGRITVDANTGALPVIDRAFAWRQLLDLMKEISAEATAGGTWGGFTFVADPATQTLRFVTFAGSSGVDRRMGGPSPLLLSPDAGSLVDVSLRYNWRESWNVSIAAGQGEGKARILSQAQNVGPAYQSPFSWREHFFDATNSANLTEVESAALADMRLGEPKLHFEATIQDTQSVRYGRDYGLGWIVSAQSKGLTFDCRVIQVHVSIDQAGGERVAARISQDVTLYS